jgi:hypothetical protein
MNEKMKNKLDKSKAFLKKNGPRLAVGVVSGIGWTLAMYYRNEIDNLWVQNRGETSLTLRGKDYDAIVAGTPKAFFGGFEDSETLYVATKDQLKE